MVHNFTLCTILLLILNCSLSTSASAQVTDIDGNTYAIVYAGRQAWLGENLRTSRFNDGRTIPVVTDSILWPSLTAPATCWYNNDSTTFHVPYGRMYNGYTALDPAICPIGWSVPTARDWDSLITTLGGNTVAGGKLKHEGTQYWYEPNTGATNEFGFTALPSGFRSHMNGSFNYQGVRAGWFVTMPGSIVAFRWVSWDLIAAGSGAIAPNAGLAIRCFRDLGVSVDEVPNPLEVKVYPNPTRGMLQISMPSTEQAQLVLSDAIGRTVYTSLLPSGTQALDISHLPTGMYILQLHSDGEILHTEKVMLVK